MADFDWSWPGQIDRDAVEASVRLDFLEKAHNVVLVAPQGLGKTMFAQNIAHAAVLAGHSVLFTTAAQMLLDLGAQDSARALDQRLRHYCTRTGLLVIDEIGYLSYAHGEVQARPSSSPFFTKLTGGRCLTHVGREGARLRML